jgi:ATP/maltotriose-dependent transcriptional regulator MalT
MADVYHIQGNLPRALEACDEAGSIATEAGAVNSRVAVLWRKASLLLAQDDLAGARSTLREYDRLRAGGVDVAAWGDRLLPAFIELAAHRPAEAAVMANNAIKNASTHPLPWEQARAKALRAEALFSQGDAADARAAVEQAWNGLRESQYRVARLEVGISYVRLTGYMSLLTSIVSEARAKRIYDLELEGRLAQAQLSRDSSQLAALRIEALSHGFRYLARRATEASAGLSH